MEKKKLYLSRVVFCHQNALRFLGRFQKPPLAYCIKSIIGILPSSFCVVLVMLLCLILRLSTRDSCSILSTSSADLREAKSTTRADVQNSRFSRKPYSAPLTEEETRAALLALDQEYLSGDSEEEERQRRKNLFAT
jgi:hypothetical protein